MGTNLKCFKSKQRMQTLLKKYDQVNRVCEYSASHPVFQDNNKLLSGGYVGKLCFHPSLKFRSCFRICWGPLVSIDLCGYHCLPMIIFLALINNVDLFHNYFIVIIICMRDKYILLHETDTRSTVLVVWVSILMFLEAMPSHVSAVLSHWPNLVFVVYKVASTISPWWPAQPVSCLMLPLPHHQTTQCTQSWHIWTGFK